MNAKKIESVLETFRRERIVACIRHDVAEEALRAARAGVDGGLRVIEVTLTTPGALEIIAELASDTRLLVGAGTVLDPEQAESVAAAGGRFALSPVTDARVIHAAHAAGLLAAPGTATPNEIFNAHRLGARLVKVFPIGQLGGAAYIRAVRGPLGRIPLLPTNGIRAEEVPEYLAAGVVALGVGREVIPPDALKRGDYLAITAASRAFVEAVRRAEPNQE